MTTNQTYHSIKERVVALITTAKVHQRSRRYFKVKNILRWLLASVTVLFGALAISSIIFRLVNSSRILPPHLGPVPPLLEFLKLVPLLWVVALFFFGYLTYLEIRSTDKGYKFELWTVLLGTLVVSLVFGIILFVLGSGYIIERSLSRHVPLHRSIDTLQIEHWQKPGEGFLVGTLSTVSSNGFSVTDPDGVEWSVVMEIPFPSHAMPSVSVGDKVGLVGTQDDALVHTFVACRIDILDFEGRGMFAHTMQPPPKIKDGIPNSIHAPTIERNFPPVRNTLCGGRTPAL